MALSVLVTRQNEHSYTARALALSGVVASGSSEAEAIAALHAALADLQNRSHIVQVELPIPSGSLVDDPWMRAAGMWADDPSWEAFQQAIAEHRDAIDAEFDEE